MTHTHN